ncbi:hypothetical protein DFA_01307 [Cavenderia fasciculata]|uniref:AMP-dependent synthetase/ligase domain-containing protein n=1 Tax=Cavenderia fasciculata TaxID=261658 RepID=F4PS40_CACFS|nr:uncharacterized protein DFA_01307 [Cavenderia fasciculata]EGG21423.1 hypothetical protein DFA_01307 [Cavenderia fasciculata]|eukprot:XP_004359273.1 hypothetical protein DFA_01307 [Cavenderia fasciculata]
MSEQETVSTTNTDSSVTTTTNVDPSSTTTTTETSADVIAAPVTTTTNKEENTTSTTSTTDNNNNNTAAAAAAAPAVVAPVPVVAAPVTTTTTNEEPATSSSSTTAPTTTTSAAPKIEAQKHHVDQNGEVSEPIPMPTTIIDALEHTIQRFPHHLAIKVKRNGIWRQWSWMQYRQDIYATAKAFIKLGLTSGGGVNIIGFNSPEWQMCQLGAIWAGGLPTGIYTTSSPEQCEYFASHSEAQFICVENETQLNKYMAIRDKLPNIKAFILMEPFDVRNPTGTANTAATTTTTTTAPATTTTAPASATTIPETTTTTDANGTSTTSTTSTTTTTTNTTTTSTGLPPGVLHWEDFLEQGRNVPDSEIDRISKAITAENLCTLIYTSGTTGMPKGCMMTQRNIAWTCYTVGSVVLHPKTGHRERFISYLPLSHVAEQVVTLYAPLVFGFSVSFADRNALQGTLLDTLLEIKPTIFFGVPRVWEKIQLKIQTTLNQSGGIKKKLVNWAKGKGIEGGYKQQRGEKKPKGYGFARALVFKKLLKGLGLDQCRFFASTAAPISKDTLEFFLSLGITVTEAYGMSELTGPQCISYPRAKTGSVGKTLPGSEVKLNPGDDEICIKGPNVFLGYYKNPEATRETIDEDGWLHTGDIGKIDENGYLFITDRKKELIITAGGENVSPALSEGYLRQIPGVNHAVVVGDRQKYIVCMLTINVEYLPKIGFNVKTLEEAIRDKSFNDYLQAKINEINLRLTQASSIKKYRICPREFADSGTDSELTPTQKLKRKIILAKYDDLIRDMYGDQYTEGTFNQPPPTLQNSFVIAGDVAIPPVDKKVETEQPKKEEQAASAAAAVVPVVIAETVVVEEQKVVDPVADEPVTVTTTTTTTAAVINDTEPAAVIITETVVVEQDPPAVVVEEKKPEEEPVVVGNKAFEESQPQPETVTVIHETVPVTVVENNPTTTEESQSSEKTTIDHPKVEPAAQSDNTTTVNIVAVPVPIMNQDLDQGNTAGEVVAAAEIIKVVEATPVDAKKKEDEPNIINNDKDENGKKDGSTSDDSSDETSSDTTSSDDDSSSSDYSTSSEESSEETDSEEYSTSSEEEKKQQLEKEKEKEKEQK